MAICQYCHREMTKAVGCKCIPFRYERKTYKPIKFGFDGMGSPGDRCGDCGALYGHYHHPGCDLERCPICGGQVISCGH